MLYQRPQYQDQSVGTLAEILLRSGRLRADQQTRLAEIAANLQTQQANAAAYATQARGQAWGNTINAAGNLAVTAAGSYDAKQAAKVPAPAATGSYPRGRL